MKPRTVRCLFFIVVLATPNLHGIYREAVGWNQLAAEIGEDVPNGKGIPVSMIESPLGGNYQPNTSNMDFSGKTFDMKSGPSGVSEHATVVGTLLFGNTMSMATGIDMIDVYNANQWVVGDFLKTGSGELPGEETRRIQNHSWAGAFTEEIHDIKGNRRFDYAIERDGFVAVVALQNVTGSVPALMAHAYNAITVGKPDGRHNRGGTVFDEPGRIRPDLVSPGEGSGLFTSYSAPVVGAAAAMLLEEADRTSGLENARHRPEVIKSILMAGATKEPFPGWERSDTLPMDEVFGAGRVNFYNSYRILTGGEQPPETNGFVADSAWHLGDTSDGDSAEYFFTFDKDRETFTANLTWHRLIELDGGTNFLEAEPLVARLELRLFEADGFVPGDEVQVSIDPVNNVQHLYLENLPAGEYALRIDVIDDPTPDGVGFALAWDAVPVIPPPPATYAEWRDRYLEGQGPEVAGPEADPARDGLANLLVYALAGEPLRSNRDRLPVKGIENVDDESYLSLTYTRPEVIEDVTYRIDASVDLLNWTEDIGEFVEDTVHDDGTVTRTWRDTEPKDSHERRFLRLTVLGEDLDGD